MQKYFVKILTTIFAVIITLPATTEAKGKVQLKTKLFFPASINVLEVEQLPENKTCAINVYTDKNYKFPFKTKGDREYLLYAIPLTGQKNIKLTVTCGNETLFFKKIKLRKRKYRTSRIYVPDKYLYPPKSALKRIKKEQELLKNTLSKTTRKKFKTLYFGYPVRRISISTPFGAIRIINGRKKSIHSGVDFRGKYGEPVFASMPGKVVIARNLYYTGKTIVIDHGMGLFTLYGHLSSIEVSEGKSVKKGELIGRIGSTGRSTGPHLHFGVYLRGIRIDPMIAIRLKENF